MENVVYEQIPVADDVKSGTNYSTGKITSKTDDAHYMIDWENEAVRAFSCIVEPEVGDIVNYCDAGDVRYILNILQRDGRAVIRLNGAYNNELHLSSKRLDIISQTTVNIIAGEDVAISSCAGAIVMAAQNLFESIADTMVQLVRNHIIKATQISAEAEQVCRMHAKHQIITAEKDVRIDGERINMG